MLNKAWINDWPELLPFFLSLWHDFLKEPFDTMPRGCEKLYMRVRELFFGFKWFEVYDFLEFVVNNHPNKSINERFKKECNSILEEEMSAYRFVGNQIVQITSEEEISEIERAMESPVETVRVHLENALKLMSDRRFPDYRNSVKESISAVEAMCKKIAHDEKATLGKALDEIEKQGRIDLHPALKEAFSKLYGYASSAEGIRHALLEEKVSLSLEDARFMLVACSAFINYLIAKSSKAGLDLKRSP